MSNQKRLFTVEDIARYRPLSKSIPKERIDPYIEEVQLIELQNVLGDALFYDLMLKFDTSGDPMYSKYQDLLNGVVYVVNSVSIQCGGLVPMLCYYTLARFFRNNPINITRYGLVTKNTEESTPVEQPAVEAAIGELKSIGINYQNRVIEFLKAKATDYPLYQYNTKELINKTGVKFFGV